MFHEFVVAGGHAQRHRLLWFERWDETALGRSGRQPRSGAEWLTEALSPTRWVFRLLDNCSLVAGLVVPALILAWLMTGVVCIRENERAVVTRFGRFESDLAPGCTGVFPFPFEQDSSRTGRPTADGANRLPQRRTTGP